MHEGRPHPVPPPTLWPALALLLLAGCSTEVSVRDNAFDPESIAPAPGLVKGLVVTDAQGALVPVAAAVVTLLDGTLEVASVETELDGRFALGSVAPGTHALRISATGYVPAVIGSIEVGPAEALDVGLIELTTQLAAGQPSVLTGTVTLEGQATHGGTVVRTLVPPFQTVTLADGSFSLQLSEGLYDVEFSHGGFVTERAPGVVLAVGSTLVLDPVVLAARPASLSGQVQARACRIDGSPETTLPADGATVTVLGTGVTGTTDANGDFNLGGLPSGLYRIRVTRIDFDPLEQGGVSLQGGQVTTLDTPLLLEGSRGDVTGLVDLVGDDDESGALIELTGTVFTGASTTRGRFLIRGACARPGQEVRASRNGYLSNSISGVEVISKQIVDVGTLKLARSQADFSLGDGSGFTASLTVSARLAAPTGTTDMRIADGDPSLFSDPARANEGWVPYSILSTVSLAGPAEGTHTLQAQSRTATSVGGVLDAAVVLDTSKPNNPLIVIESGSGYSRDPDGALLLNLSASELPGPGVDRVAGLAEVKLINVDLQACASPPCPPAPPTQARWDASTAIPFLQVVDHPLLRPSTDEAKEIWARFSDRAGNWSDATSAQVVLDRLAPGGLLLQIDNNSTWTRQAIVSLTIDAIDANPGLSMRLSNTTSFLGAPWQPLVNNITWFLPTGDGTKTVYAEFKDLAGNISGAISDSIEVDTVAPGGLSLTVAQAPYSATRSIDLVLAATGAPEMVVFSAAELGNPFSWIPFSTSHTFLLPNADGPQRVYVLFRDAAGNLSPRLEADLVLDRVPPDVGTTALIEGGVVSSPNVNLEVFALASPTEAYQERIDVTDLGSGTLTPGSWGPFSLVTPVTLPAPAGDKRIELQLRDAAGNISTPAPLFVTWDSTPPALTSFEIAGGAAYTSTPSVTATLVATGASQMRLSERADFADAIWRPFVASLPLLLSPGEGLKTVYLELRDAASNLSSSSTSITLDTQPPTPVSVSLDAGAATSNDGVVDLLFTGLDAGSGISRALVSNEATFASATLVAWGGSGSEALASWTLLPGEGLRTVRARFEDAAGNLQDTSAQIIVDTIAPGGQLLIDADANGISDPYTQTANVVLEIRNTTQAFEMAIANTAPACATESYVPFVQSPSWTLSAGDGNKSVQVCVRDAAGNSSRLMVSIVLDTTAPGVSFSIDADADGSGGDPWSVNTQVRLLMSAPADTHRVALVNAATLDCQTAVYEPFTTTREWLLSLGDGGKSVSACFLDDAGNASLASATILLDTTPPSTPDLFRTGISDTCIDLQWTASPDADLAGYVLERQIDGATVFSTIGTPAPGTTTVTDAWCAACDRSQCLPAANATHLGLGHAYRIRAIDTHGLVSPDSAVVRAGTPHAPPTALSITLPTDRHLEWARPAGVSLTLGTYRYEDPTGTIIDAPIPVNATRYAPLLPNTVTAYPMNEAILLQTTNSDGSLTWSSRFELGHLRETLVGSGATGLIGMDLDPAGVLHLAYVSSGNLIYLVNDGVTAPTTVYSGSVGGKDLALKVDPAGIAHVAFYDTALRQLHSLKLDGTSSVQVIDPTLDAGKTLDLAVDSSGRPHIIYEVQDDNTLRYSLNAGVGQVVFSGTPTNLSATMNPSIVLIKGIPDFPWVVYSNPWSGQVEWAKIIPSPFTFTSGVVENGFVAESTAIAEDQDGHIHFAFVTTNVVHHCERIDVFTTTCQSVSPVSAFPSDIQMVVDRDDVPIFGYRDRSTLSLYYQEGPTGTDAEIVDRIGQAGNDLQMALASDRATTHLLHRDLTDNSLRHLVIQPPARLSEFDEGVGLPGLGLDLVVARKGRAHMSYHDALARTLRYANSKKPMTPISPDGSSNNVGSDTAIALDLSGAPVITYPDKTQNNLYAVRIDGSITPDLLVNLGTGPTPDILSSAIAYDSTGWAHVSYQDTPNQGLWHLLYSAGPPINVVQQDVSPTLVGRDSAIAIDSGNTAHIVYPVYTGPDGLRLLIPGSAPLVILSSATSPRRPAIAIDSTGLIHVVYYDALNGDLGLVTVSGTTPTATTLVSAGDTGEDPDIAIDSQDIPHIVYRDVSNGTLQYLRLDGSSLPLTLDGGRSTGFEASIDIGPGDVPNVACQVAGPPSSVAFIRGPFLEKKSPVSITRIQ